MEGLSGKKLLILGAYESEAEIVREAKRLGIYTIVTDNHTDWSMAPAKYVADEAWDISWSDIELLSKKCMEEKIDGCLAGFSERRITYAQMLCERLKMPFYAAGADLRSICNKDLFKKACIESGITVPKQYQYSDDIMFPVIVKPSDNAGSRGISICYNRSELENAYNNALLYSDNGNIVIEEYIIADEIMVYFTVHNGIIDISAMCDRYMHRFNNRVTQLPVGYYYPSKYLDVLIKYNIDKFKDLIKRLKIRDGLIAFQCFVLGNDIIPFDPTYRLDGTMSYHIIEKINGINVLHLLLAKSLTGKMGDDREISKREDPLFGIPAFELPILLGKGTISRIEGIEEVQRMPDVVFVNVMKSIGDTMEKDADFSQMLCRVHICAESVGALKKDIEDAASKICVYDEKGNDMVIGRESVELEAQGL